MRSALALTAVLIGGCASTQKEEPPPPPTSSGPIEQLNKGQIVRGMQALKPGVGACYDRFRVPGIGSVALTIVGTGRVESVRVVGDFAGTPTGACLEDVVRQATFPAFTGSPQSVVYPFILR